MPANPSNPAEGRPALSLAIRPGPFLEHPVTTPTLMRDVVLALLPPLVAGVWYFGIQALFVVTSAIVGALLTEWTFGGRGRTFRDWTGALTGLLVGMTLPPGIQLWMAFVAGVAAIGLGKLIWGGLGQNLFNPALVGRAFVQSAFPISITTWAAHGEGFFRWSNATFALPLMQPSTDVVSKATPLGMLKFAEESTDLLPLLLGNTSGSIGETSGLVILLAGAWLLWRRAFDWRIPASILLTVCLFSAVVYGVADAVDAVRDYPSPAFMLLSGSLLFGSVYMATDPVTSPMSPNGTWLYGVGIGVLVVIIRLWGGLPEGVMYAILLMNAATPLINKKFPTRPFGRGGRA